ncbi:MAG: MFS transporter [Firmicutes bacterium]|nr:MFS transporter [Bacillota bacterium]
MKKLAPFTLPRQILYSVGSLSFNLTERMILLYAAFYYLPPKEYGLPELFPGQTFWGFLTIFGLVMVVGRVFDALADPVVASLSDRSTSRLGRRKVFKLLSALPMVLAAALVFFPPFNNSENIINGIWFGVVMSVFYIAFTAYANPFLALVSELGQDESTRINMNTFIAILGLLGVALVTVAFTPIVTYLQSRGIGIRESYQWAAMGFAAIACVAGYISLLSYDEKKHCLPVEPVDTGIIESLKRTFGVKHFITFLTGELFLMFCVNIVTLGMMYYAVVIFQKDQGFMTYIAGAALLGSMISFPFVSYLGKKIGKKKVIVFSVAFFSAAMMLFFLLSFRMNETLVYVCLALFVLCGFPLAALSSLVYSTTSDIAREDALRTGVRREAMFYGARALPLKIVIALSGLTFGFLISRYGKDVAEPLGVQLSLLVVSICALIGLFFFARYPEEKVLSSLKEHEQRIAALPDDTHGEGGEKGTKS